MLDVVRELAALDLQLTHETAELRWGPATTVFAFASLWWIKGPLLVGLGGVSDGMRRRLVPFVMLASAAAFAVASIVNVGLKALVDRHRPPVTDPDIAYVGSLPSSPSFPSGHAMTAFAAATAIALQCAGWGLQLLAVYAAMRAFRIDEPLHAPGLVLVLMNVATIFPLWPGNIGLLQAAVALPLVSYGVAYAHGFAFGLGLQVIEVSVGVGLGLLYLTREGLSFAMLKRIPASPDVDGAEPAGSLERDGAEARARARVPG